MRYRIYDVARDENNDPVVGASVSLRRIVDNVEIASTTTGADGAFGFTEADVEYPGPIKVRVTAPDGVTRERSGLSTGQVDTYFMSDLMRAFAMMTDGVFLGYEDELEVTADGGGMDVDVAKGMAFIQGHPSYWPVSTNLTVTANATGNPRIDTVVLRLTMPGETERGKAVLAVKAGTAASSPVAPALTQDPDDVWEIALADIAVASGASSIALGNVTDRRDYTSGPLMDGSITTAKILANAVTAAKISNESNFSTAGIAKVLKAHTANPTPVWAGIKLSELEDVDEAAATNGQVLAWNTANSEWEAKTIGSSMAGLSDVDLTSPSDGDILAYDNGDSEWKNVDIYDALGVTKPVTGADLDPLEGLGGLSPVKLIDRLGSMAGDIGLRSLTSHTHTMHPIVFGSNTRAHTSPVTVNTSNVDVSNFNLTLASGVNYQVFAYGTMQANASAGGTITAYMRIEAGDTPVAGFGTATVGGERQIAAFHGKSVTGTGGSINISLRAQSTNSGASANGALVFALAIPVDIPVED